MTRVRRGAFYTLLDPSYGLGYSDPEGALVLSNPAWISAANSATCAFVWRHSVPPGPEHVDVGEGLYVDCRQLFPVLHEDFGRCWEPDATPTELAQVEFHITRLLSIPALIGRSPDAPAALTTTWCPTRGMVREVDHPHGRPHGYVCMSAAESNARCGMASGLMLTSQTKTWRRPWEVQRPDGKWVVTGDVYTFPNDAFRVTNNPLNDIPSALDGDTLVRCAAGVQAALDLP